jgi:hypothetical protein
MPKQTLSDLFNDTESRRRIAEEDEENRLFDGSWRDPMMPNPPEDDDEEPTVSVADQLGAQAIKARSAYPDKGDIYNGKKAGSSATTLAGQLFPER